MTQYNRPSEGRFEGRTVIVTGASSGIGRATAVRIAAEGGAVACLDVVEEALKETVGSIVSAGGQAVAYRCDVSDEAGVIETVAQATRRSVGSASCATWPGSGRSPIPPTCPSTCGRRSWP